MTVQRVMNKHLHSSFTWIALLSPSDSRRIAIKVVEREPREAPRPQFVQRLLDILWHGDRQRKWITVHESLKIRRVSPMPSPKTSALGRGHSSMHHLGVVP